METRIALVPLYFTLFDEYMPAGLRERRQQTAASVSSQLPERAPTLVLPMVDSPTAAIEAARALREFNPDGVILLPTMAAPPSYVTPVLEACPDAEVLLTVIQRSDEVLHPYDTDVATEGSAPVGASMISNILVRQGRRFELALGALGSAELAERFDAWARGLVAAAVVRSLRLGVVGDPIDGYIDVEVGDEDLRRLGPTPVHISSDLLTDRFATAVPLRPADLPAGLQGAVEDSRLDPNVLSRSLQLCSALRRISEEQRLHGGTVNCHGPLLRWNPEIGITACLAVSDHSTRGQHYSCTGDIPTAIVLALGNALAGSALYGELYQLDLLGDWALFANGGEGDVRCSAGSVELAEEDHYLGERGPGVAVAFGFSKGPATLLSLSPVAAALGGWVLVAAHGEVLGAGYPELEGPHGRFRFDDTPVDDGFGRWLQAGATHHAALIPGHHRSALQTCATRLGIELREI